MICLDGAEWKDVCGSVYYDHQSWGLFEGLFEPDQKCSKTGQPAITVLYEYHPNSIVPSAEDLDEHPGGQELLESPPVYYLRRQRQRR